MTLCQGKNKDNYQKNIILDSANGVGSILMNKLLKLKGVKDRLNIQLINDEQIPDNLNVDCGADYLNT